MEASCNDHNKNTPSLWNQYRYIILRDDGIYTAFFDAKRTGIVGPFEIQTIFEKKNDILGKYTFTKPIPVYVPQSGTIGRRQM